MPKKANKFSPITIIILALMAGFSLLIVYRQHNSSKQSDIISRSKRSKKADRDLESVNDKYSEQKDRVQKGKLYENAAKKPSPKTQ